jgi:hypothetical protein
MANPFAKYAAPAQPNPFDKYAAGNDPVTAQSRVPVTVNDMRALGFGAPARKPVTAPRKAGPLEDVAMSGLEGLKNGAAMVADSLSTAIPFMNPTAALRSPLGMLGFNATPGDVVANATSPASLARALAPSYTPQTKAGRYAKTIGEFAPGAVGGEGGLVRKGLQVVVPAVASEFAGQKAEEMGASPLVQAGVRAATALGAGGLTAGVNGVPKALKVPKPSLAAGRGVARALGRDEEAVPVAEFKARLAAGESPITAGGENLAGMAEVLAQTPGKGRTSMIKAVRDLQAEVPNQVKADIGHSLGGQGDYFATLDKAIEQRASAAAPHREAAFSTPLDPTKYQSEVAPFMGRVPSRALSYAADIAKREGVSPTELGMEVVGVTPDGLLPEVRQTSQPTMKALHYIKKGLDRDIEANTDLTTGRMNTTGAVTSELRGGFGRALRRISPDYDKFMQTWGDESDHIKALDMGRKVFSEAQTMPTERLASWWNDLSDTGKDMYRKGVGEALVAQVRSSKGGVGTMRNLLKSEDIRDRVAMAFPDQQSFTGFMERAAKRVDDQGRFNNITANSRTAFRQAALADGADHSMDLADGIDLALSATHPAALTGKALKKVLKAVPRKDKGLYQDPDSNAALGQAFATPEGMKALLDGLDTHTAAVVAARIRALQAAPQIAAPAVLAVPRVGQTEQRP